MRENINLFCFLNLQWLLLSLVITFLDLFLKNWVMSYCILGKPIFVSSFLNVYYTYNFGIAFSLFSEFGLNRSVILSLVTIIIILVLCLILCFIDSSYAYFLKIAYAIVIGGALGNLIDRIRHGFVVDFIDFHIWYWHFPTFNIADLSIFIGVIMMIIYYYK